MIIRQLVNECLAEASYYLESEGEAAVIDPMRNPAPYLEIARDHGAIIRYVFETHFHADFVSGHQPLAEATGATIVYGPTAAPLYKAHVAADNEEFALGKLTLRALHTPGHSLESTCYLVLDEHGQPKTLFTGDTLLIDDVGRPDLVQQVRAELTPAFLAGLQFDALRNKIAGLPDEVIIYPGHLKGSPCGTHISEGRSDTLGHQRQTNMVLDPGLNRDDFISRQTRDLPAPPPHFAFNVLLNQQGGLPAVADQAGLCLKPLLPQDFLKLQQQEEAMILDTRNLHAFPEAFIPGALFVGLEEQFSRWVGTLINNLQQPLLLVADPGTEADVVARLANIGYDSVLGYLQGSMPAWLDAGQPTEHMQLMPPNMLRQHLEQDQAIKILDLRSPEDFDGSHLPGAHQFALEYLVRNLKYLPKDQHYFLYCASGYRSLVAASYMKRAGFNMVTPIDGGLPAIRQTGIRLETELRTADE
ncbi:MAG: rhodanese-like domain-containing protein [Chitinophagaceae bacterium]|nr:rhodanese-like domain-containing protein [Chitinophagaceae bacterium]